MTPPKPPSRPEGAGPLARLRLFRKDIFRSQPGRLYHAWMAEMRTPISRSFLVNDPTIVSQVLRDAPEDFPKANLIGAVLRPLLGQSVFVTNGAQWRAQRRVIDPAFEGGRLKAQFPAMRAAVEEAVAHWPEGEADAEPLCSRLAADIIFRTLFSRPITDDDARAVFAAFQAYQRSQPVLSPLALLRLPSLRRGGRFARAARAPIERMVTARAREIADGTAPDDLATRLMTTPDPETGRCFGTREMIDQVAIFFLAGHETSASALAWALWLLATHPQVQAEAREEAQVELAAPSDLSRFPLLRDVMRETLRLYPPVPMMVRESTRAQTWRGRDVPKRSLVILSPWHLHRHTRLWDDPDAFKPERWQTPPPREQYMPFSQGPRICPGAGFAMMESVLALHRLLRAFEFAPEDEVPVPVAHLTVRSENGIRLRATRRV